MSSFKDINIARENLVRGLGSKSKQYYHLMKLWFQMKSTKENFDFQARRLLDPSQIHLHNTYLLQLLLTRSKQDLPASSKRFHCKTSKRESLQHDNGFQPVDVHDYVQARLPHKPHMVSGQSCVQDLLLPDSELIHMRLLMGAWELGLEGAEPGAAQLLEAAVQHFLKNILQTIFSRRNGFRAREDNVQYAVGTPAPNPWLRNTVGLFSGRNDRSVLEMTEEGESIPVGQPSGSDTQQDIALTYAASLNQPHKQPVSLIECYQTLQIFRSAVKSNGVYSINMERMAAAMHHPSWDHMEE